MTIKAGKHNRVYSQNDKVLVFDGENEEQVMVKKANEHEKLLTSLCDDAAHQDHFAKHRERETDNAQEVNMEDKRSNVRENDSRKDKNQVIANLTSDGDCDHLLILAQSAEMMLDSYESDLLQNAGDAANEGEISAVKQINEMPAIKYRREESQSITPRLTQIRHLARSRGKFAAQPMNGKHTGWNLQGKRVRLTDMRRLARHKFQMHAQGGEEKQLSGISGERTIRLTKLKQMARFKNNSLMFTAVHDCIPAHLHCQTSEGPENQKAKIIEAIFGVDDSLQVEVDGEASRENISSKDRRKVSRSQT